MDRNQDCAEVFTPSRVALRKESVDRNAGMHTLFAELCVALRKESVDRNAVQGADMYKVAASLSARRAWIEIAASACALSANGVALRKESVDRNMAASSLIYQ